MSIDQLQRHQGGRPGLRYFADPSSVGPPIDWETARGGMRSEALEVGRLLPPLLVRVTAYPLPRAARRPDGRLVGGLKLAATAVRLLDALHEARSVPLPAGTWSKEDVRRLRDWERRVFCDSTDRTTVALLVGCERPVASGNPSLGMLAFLRPTEGGAHLHLPDEATIVRWARTLARWCGTPQAAAEVAARHRFTELAGGPPLLPLRPSPGPLRAA